MAKLGRLVVNSTKSK